MSQPNPPKKPELSDHGLTSSIWHDYQELKKSKGRSEDVKNSEKKEGIGIGMILSWIFSSEKNDEKKVATAKQPAQGTYDDFKRKHNDGTFQKCQQFELLLNSYQIGEEKYEELQRYGQEQLLRKKKSFWQELDGYAFEKEFANILKRLGYQAKIMGGAGDDGIDIIATKADREIIVQCKAYKDKVSPNLVREFNGAWDMKNGKTGEAWLIGLGGFSENATNTGKQCGIKLLSLNDVMALHDKSNTYHPNDL